MDNIAPIAGNSLLTHMTSSFMPHPDAVMSLHNTGGQNKLLEEKNRCYHLYRARSRKAFATEGRSYRVEHQYSILESVATMVETHYLRWRPIRLRSMTVMNDSNPDNVEERNMVMKPLFEHAIQAFSEAADQAAEAWTKARGGNSCTILGRRNSVPPLALTDKVQFRMFNRIPGPTTGAGVGSVPVMTNETEFRGGMITPMVPWVDVNADMIMRILTSMIQSREFWIVDVNTVFVFTVIRASASDVDRVNARYRFGQGPPVRANAAQMRSMVSPEQDSLCAARAIGLCYTREWDKHMYSQIKRSDRTPQKKWAVDLHMKSGVPILPQGVSFEQLETFADFLKVQIFVTDHLTASDKEFCFVTSQNYEKNITLWYEGGATNMIGHFSAVYSVPRLFKVERYCMSCRVNYSRKREHVCGSSLCTICKGSRCDVVQPVDVTNMHKWIVCTDCRRRFPTQTCFDEHIRVRTCEKFWWCIPCGEMIRSLRVNHECGVSQARKQSAVQTRKSNSDGSKKNACNRCYAELEGPLDDHVCYIMPRVEDTEKSEERRFIYFDFETTQYLGPHIVNLAVSLVEDSNEPVVHETLDEFCEWLFTEEHTNYICLAHNGKGYDFQFIRAWCYKKQRTLSVINTGMKIMKMVDEESGITFIDTLNFLPMALSSFTKTFNLGDTVDGRALKKGYFPHFFNTPLHVARYSGDVPHERYFGVSSFRSESDVMRFRAWHDKRQMEVDNGNPYNFKQELVEYCESDVFLLRAGAMRLRELFIGNTGIDPFGNVTIASTCMAIFRTNFLQPGVLVRDVPKVEHSTFSTWRIEWCTYMAEQRGEVLTLPDPSAVDGVAYGFVDGVKTSVYHFLSDYEHGNLSVYAGNVYNKSKGCQMSTLAGMRASQHSRYESEGLEVLSKWQSAWAYERGNADFKEWYTQANVKGVLKTPLNPRNAFFGGRTNACKLIYNFDEELDEYGMYVDICSLYPTVNRYDPYPIGLPDVYVNNEGSWSVKGRECKQFEEYPEAPDVSQMFGFIKCTVECPTDLYHPVLPHKHMNGKLTFDLVSPKRGTWTTVELKLALEKGYVITHIDEIWDYESSTIIFKEYVDTFIKIKQEASGWPNGVETEEQKLAYLAKFKEDMDFELDRDKIEFNPGLRAMAKLALNSLWGKFGERSNLTETKTVYTHAALMKILDDDKYNIKYVTSITPQATEVGFTMKEEFMSLFGRVGNVNVGVAAFTTSHARTRLYYALNVLQRQVLYYDTDSVIYKYQPNTSDVHIKTGDNLGEWTDELDGGKLVGTFASSGPKSYSYTKMAMTGNLSDTTKVKGFTLNLRNSLMINQQSLTKVIRGRGKVKIATLNPTRIKLGKSATAPVYKTEEKKLFGFTYSKRHILPYNEKCIDTVPFGHDDAVGTNTISEVETIDEPAQEQRIDFSHQGGEDGMEDESNESDEGGYDAGASSSLHSSDEDYDTLSDGEISATQSLITESDHRAMLEDYVLVQD